MRKKVAVLIILAVAVTTGFGFSKPTKQELSETYKCEGDLFGKLDNYTNIVHSEYLERDIGQFVIFYKYGELQYSSASMPSVDNIYYLAYEKVSRGVYVVTVNNDSFVFTPVLNGSGGVYTYEEYVKNLKETK